MSYNLQTPNWWNLAAVRIDQNLWTKYWVYVKNISRNTLYEIKIQSQGVCYDNGIEKTCCNPHLEHEIKGTFTVNDTEVSDIKKQYLKNIKTTKELDDSQGINALSWLWSFFKSISKYIAILVCIVVILLIVYFCCIQRNLISTVVNSVGTDTVQVFDARFNDHRSVTDKIP